MKKKCNRKETVVKTESTLECKATASVNKQVAEEMKEKDKPIEELLNNAQDPE